MNTLGTKNIGVVGEIIREQIKILMKQEEIKQMKKLKTVFCSVCGFKVGECELKDFELSKKLSGQLCSNKSLHDDKTYLKQQGVLNNG